MNPPNSSQTLRRIVTEPTFRPATLAQQLLVHEFNETRLGGDRELSPPAQVRRDHLLAAQRIDLSALAKRVGMTLCDDAFEAQVTA